MNVFFKTIAKSQPEKKKEEKYSCFSDFCQFKLQDVVTGYLQQQKEAVSVSVGLFILGL